ncbi:uncharacterized protein si:dkey-237j10.2 isoform X1 [Pleuronectes platessa]|uniref:uncharacterized protein si:dkey-237j10.2 isoform X1 n=1 Tax=Pleuronectes platessa TaxID=8262 RepID=UPI00232A787A|nr:uncharacterized protein si:dkey-237j10.2 isoform X1 [Pleuronectes platessa]
MLAEGFLRVQHYREEKQIASASRRDKTQTHGTDQVSCILSSSDSTDSLSYSTEADPNQEELDSTQPQGLRVGPPGPIGLSIPGCPPALTLDQDFTVCIDDCSLLEQYPDLQVADSGRISHNPLRATIAQHGLYNPVSEVQHQAEQAAQQELQREPVPDQGYMVMGSSVNVSLGLPGSGLEPMSNSLLNGLLEKQLEEVYMQHMTDNLARCSSYMENSLLRGLVLPQGPDSLEVSLEEGPGGGAEKKISYLSTQNLVPCSSNFSSPVLRISENDNTYPK